MKSNFAMILKIDRFRSQVMMLERRMQTCDVPLFAYINLN